MENRVTLQMHYDLPPSLARLLLLLVKHKFVTAEMIEVKYELMTQSKIAIHRLRQKLEGKNVEIQSRRGVGYWIDEETRMMIYDLLKHNQTADGNELELPLGDGGEIA